MVIRRHSDLTRSGRSLTKTNNSIGPKTDPWGTPECTEIVSELSHQSQHLVFIVKER